MGYISKENLLEAYKVLSTNTSTPTNQGATQYISAIRYYTFEPMQNRGNKYIPWSNPKHLMYD